MGLRTVHRDGHVEVEKAYSFGMRVFLVAFAVCVPRILSLERPVNGVYGVYVYTTAIPPGFLPVS